MMAHLILHSVPFSFQTSEISEGHQQILTTAKWCISLGQGESLSIRQGIRRDIQSDGEKGKYDQIMNLLYIFLNMFKFQESYKTFAKEGKKWC